MSNNACESRKYTKYLRNELGHGGRGYRALLKLYKEFAAVLESLGTGDRIFSLSPHVPNFCCARQIQKFPG